MLKELLTLLKLERIEENIFRGQSKNLGWCNVFGGQVLGQALSAVPKLFLKPAGAQPACLFQIEIRQVNPSDPFAPQSQPTQRFVWFKAIDTMPDDRAAHRYLLAYASDFNLMATSLYRHGHTSWESDMEVASLDHALWFHRDFRMDDWLLYVMQSPNACKARGLSIGRIFTRQGILAATVAQEGLIRYRGYNKGNH